MIFETHAHYDDEAFDPDRDSLLREISSGNIKYVVNIGASLASIKSTVTLAEYYPFVYASAGVHPSDTKELTDENFSCIEEAASHPKVVAIGEIGLDYYWDEPERPIQKYWFERQLLLAKEVDLPVIIHSRDAAKDTLDMLKSESARGLKGIIHCYAYSVEIAREYVDMGYYLGIGGVVTFKKSRQLKEVVAAIPLDRLVVETDSPYLSPDPLRGKRNTSLNLPYIIRAIADIKNISPEEVERITFENAINVYRLCNSND